MIEKAGVAGIGAAAMGDAEAFDMAARQMDDMEARLAPNPARNRPLPMKSRWRIQRRELSAALAFANSAGLMPAGADGAIGAAGTGASGSTEAIGGGRIDGPRICELAAPDSRSPPAPAAPKRNISRQFNDIYSLPLCKRPLYR